MGKDPVDPLAVAAEEAAKNRGIARLMNVFPDGGVEPVPKGFKHPWAEALLFMVDHRAC